VSQQRDTFSKSLHGHLLKTWGSPLADIHQATESPQISNDVTGQEATESPTVTAPKPSLAGSKRKRVETTNADQAPLSPPRLTRNLVATLDPGKPLPINPVPLRRLSANLPSVGPLYSFLRAHPDLSKPAKIQTAANLQEAPSVNSAAAPTAQPLSVSEPSPTGVSQSSNSSNSEKLPVQGSPKRVKRELENPNTNCDKNFTLIVSSA
jgi:hypothetical protein